MTAMQETGDQTLPEETNFTYFASIFKLSGGFVTLCKGVQSKDPVFS
jgi:hypothetical protein